MQLTRLLTHVDCGVRVLAPTLSPEKMAELTVMGARVLPDFDYRRFPWAATTGFPHVLGIALVDEDDAANIKTAFQLSSACGGASQCLPIALRVSNDAVARCVEATLPHCIALSVSALGARAFVRRALADENLRPRASFLHRPVPALADPSDTVTYVQGKAIVFRSPRRFSIRGTHLATIAVRQGRVSIDLPPSQDAEVEVIDAGQAKLWRGRAHWTWLAWLRWHLRRTLGAPASIIRKTAGSSMYLRLAAVVIVTVVAAAAEGALQNRPLLQVLSLPSLILSVLATVFLSERRNAAAHPRTALWRRQSQLSAFLVSVGKRVVRDEAHRKRYVAGACGLVLLALTVALSLLAFPVWIRLVSAAAVLAEFGSRSRTVRRYQRRSLVLGLLGVPLLSAAISFGSGASKTVSVITGARWHSSWPPFGSGARHLDG